MIRAGVGEVVGSETHAEQHGGRAEDASTAEESGHTIDSCTHSDRADGDSRGAFGLAQHQPCHEEDGHSREQDLSDAGFFECARDLCTDR